MAKRKAKRAKRAVAKRAPKRRVKRAVSAVKRAVAKVRTVYKTRKAAFVEKRKIRKSKIGGGSGLGLNKPTGIIKMTGLAIAGGIGGSMLASKIPIKNKKIQALIPLGIGGGLAFTKLSKKPEILGLAIGLMLAGSYGMIRQLAPKLPLIAGEEDLLFPTTAEGKAMLGYSKDDISGEWMNDDDDISGNWMNEDDDLQGEIQLADEIDISGGWQV